MNKYVFILCTCLVFGGCKSKKTMSNGNSTSQGSAHGGTEGSTQGNIDSMSQVNKNSNVTASEQSRFLSNADTANLHFNTFNAKGKAEIELNGSRHSVTVNLRIKKDQIIWAYFNLGFIPLAQAYITPDSIKVINLIQGGYIHKDFAFLRQYSSQAVDFKTLQALLTGNKPDSFITAGSVFSVINEAYRLKGKDETLDFTLEFDKRFKPAEIFLQNVPKKQELRVRYQNQQDLGGKLAPATIFMSSHVEGKTFTLNLTYKKITLDEELDFPFNAPSGN